MVTVILYELLTLILIMNLYFLAMPIVRPSVQIGDDLFNRPVSPGTSMLYQVTYFTVVESCAQLGK